MRNLKECDDNSLAPGYTRGPMDAAQLRALLGQLESGHLSVDQVSAQLERLPFADLGFARVDHHRALRQGIPEVVFAQGKAPEHVCAITAELVGRGQPVLLTRLDPAVALSLKQTHPSLRHNPVARTAWIPGRVPDFRVQARVAVVTAGSSGLPVAEEAIETLAACGVNAHALNDVGVAGIHRLLPEVERLRGFQCVIVVAGMEGALASVVGGLLRCPVIAVPTSVGYGAAFGGMAALLGMLTTCASGVTVVNIDNGFGAAIAAIRQVDQIWEHAGSGLHAPPQREAL